MLDEIMVEGVMQVGVVGWKVRGTLLALDPHRLYDAYDG